MPFAAPASLSGLRVLVVEDEMVVALVIEDCLAELGCVVAGTCGTVAQALGAVRALGFDLAVLNINLHGERSCPVADALDARRIPFLFVSGYGDAAIVPGHASRKVCGKPFQIEDLAAMLVAALAMG